MENYSLQTVAVHFSTRCSAACSFCYFSDPIGDRVEPTPLENIKRIITEVSNAGVKEILFVGGDPVIHPNFLESLELSKDKNLIISVLSNSWNIKPKEKFEKIVSLIDFCETTILSSKEKVHDELTQRKGSFDGLIKNLQKIESYGKKIGICINIMPQNLNSIYETIKDLHFKFKIEIRSLMIQRIIPSGMAVGKFKFGVNIDDIKIIMSQIDRISIEFGIPIYFEDPVPWCTVDPIYHKYLSRCEWGYTRASINSQGLLNRCGADDHYRLGSIFDKPLQDIWRTHPILQSFRSKKYLADECQSCVLLERCGGGCPLSCGTLKDHGLDHLYIQKIQINSIGKYKKNSLNLIKNEHTKLRFIKRYAYSKDLKDITDLEAKLFKEESLLFNSNNIKSYFERCPKAFRVIFFGERLVGYSIIFPLNNKGLIDIEKNKHLSTTNMDISGINPNFGTQKRAFFIEVIAVDLDTPKLVSIALLKDIVLTVKDTQLPVYTCPISKAGKKISEKLGFLDFHNEDMEKNNKSKITLKKLIKY